MTQSAVEWLVETMINSAGMNQFEIDEVIKKSLEMEKQQIIHAYKHGQNNEFSHLMVGKLLITGEEYYEQTYKTQAQ